MEMEMKNGKLAGNALLLSIHYMALDVEIMQKSNGK